MPTSPDDLMQKLALSRKIMDKHKEIPRGGVNGNINTSPDVEEYEAPPAKFNLPPDLLGEEAMIEKRKHIDTAPDKDSIVNSKLPDEIKKLMLTHPIAQASMPANTLSNELVEKAARLMNTKPNGERINENATPKKRIDSTSNITPQNTDLKKLVKEAVREILTENGLITESTEKANDIFVFRVGSHTFTGKINKITRSK